MKSKMKAGKASIFIPRERVSRTDSRSLRLNLQEGNLHFDQNRHGNRTFDQNYPKGNP
jgi:hypothetical protein